MSIKSLGYLCLHNVGLQKMLDIFNCKSKPKPTCLFGLVRTRKLINWNILTNPNPLPSALGRNLEYLALDQESHQEEMCVESCHRGMVAGGNSLEWKQSDAQGRS